jgi:hypothetical protein
MSTTLETRVRRELDREASRIEQVRRDAHGLKPALRAKHAEVVADLDAAWSRAQDAIDRLVLAVGEEAAAASREFEDAWTALKVLLRTVCL